MKAFMLRTLNGLVPDPSDERSGDMLRGVRIGEAVLCEVKKPRNIQHHRLYWALVGKIAAGIGAKPENVHAVLKIRTGHYTLIETKMGPIKVPKPTDFKSMDQQEFRAFFDACCREICFEWLPHMKATELRAEVLQMMGISWTEVGSDRETARTPAA